MDHAPTFSISSLPALWEPHYGATLRIACWRFFKKYVSFSGRASLNEYWWMYLVTSLYSMVMGVIMFVVSVALAAKCFMAPSCATSGGAGLMALQGLLLTVAVLVALAVLLPWLGLSARRLHDTNHSAHFLWLIFVPLVGSIIVLVLTTQKSDPAGARFDLAPHLDVAIPSPEGVLQG